jgi:hypothetical protein
MAMHLAKNEWVHKLKTWGACRSRHSVRHRGVFVEKPGRAQCVVGAAAGSATDAAANTAAWGKLLRRVLM